MPVGAAGYAVVLADANGGFQAPVVHPVAAGASIVHTPTDLNGDGHLDLLIAEGEDEDASTGTASVAFGDGAGGFSAPVSAFGRSLLLPGTGRRERRRPRGPRRALHRSTVLACGLVTGRAASGRRCSSRMRPTTGQTTGDVNGDGRPDIVTGDRHGQLNVFFNNCGAAPANLSVALTESADPVNEGDELTYTVTVTNQTGTPATGVRLRSVLSPTTQEDPEEPNVEALGITSSAGGTLATAGSTYTWDLPTLAANGTATFQFRFRPLGGAILELCDSRHERRRGDGSRGQRGVRRYDGNARAADSSSSRTRTTADLARCGRPSLESNDPGDVDTIVFNIAPARTEDHHSAEAAADDRRSRRSSMARRSRAMPGRRSSS